MVSSTGVFSFTVFSWETAGRGSSSYDGGGRAGSSSSSSSLWMNPPSSSLWEGFFLYGVPVWVVSCMGESSPWDNYFPFVSPLYSRCFCRPQKMYVTRCVISYQHFHGKIVVSCFIFFLKRSSFVFEKIRRTMDILFVVAGLS